MNSKVVPAGAFKQGCLAMLDEVEAQHCEIVITKRGRPVARLVPMPDPAETESKMLAELRKHSRVLVSEKELLSPSSEIADWGPNEGPQA